jgi:hypothetical protein
MAEGIGFAILFTGGLIGGICASIAMIKHLKRQEKKLEITKEKYQYLVGMTMDQAKRDCESRKSGKKSLKIRKWKFVKIENPEHILKEYYMGHDDKSDWIYISDRYDEHGNYHDEYDGPNNIYQPTPIVHVKTDENHVIIKVGSSAHDL